MQKPHRPRIGFGLESLEARDLLTAVPFGAALQDTSEFLLGDVAVNVVFLESNGAIDEDTEQWTPELTAGVKATIEEGLKWWTDTLALYSDVHHLHFDIDYTLADDPFETSYEPISRGSQDFDLWIEEFFRQVGVAPSPGFTDEIRTFNHQQRVAHEANWSFTIFVVNSENDPNGRFGDDKAKGTVFQRAFAYPGGQFIVMPHDRPAATVAHELGHMFWAFDEYSKGDNYHDVRGYYASQNTNGFKGNPEPNTREPSIMASTGSPFANHEISQSARETVGWRDSDRDGIFDVLDVPHTLTATANFNESDRTIHLIGQSSVQTLDNKNPSGTGNDMTLNRITDLQYRIDRGSWMDLHAYDDYTVAVNVVTPEIPDGASLVEFRTIDDRIGVTSNTVHATVGDATTPILQNPLNPLDVSGDGFVSAIDALQVINTINEGISKPTESGPPYVDVSGDSTVTSRDVLLVINYINSQSKLQTSVAMRSSAESNSNPQTGMQEADASSVSRSDSVPTLPSISETVAAVWSLFSSVTEDGEPDFWPEGEHPALLS